MLDGRQHIVPNPRWRILGCVPFYMDRHDFAGLTAVDAAKMHLQDPELQASFRTSGVEAMSMPPEEFNAYLRAEYEKWGKVVHETGATVN